MEEKDYKKITQYLDNQLSEEEMLAFEAEVEAQPEMAEALKLELKIRYNNYVSFSRERKEYYRQLRESHVAKPRSLVRRQWIAAAAVILALLLLGYLIVNPFSSPTDPQQLFADNFNKTELPTVRSASSDARSRQDSVWNQALENFASKEFQHAIPQLQILTSEKNFSYRNQAFLYLGISMLKRRPCRGSDCQPFTNT